MCVKRVSVPDIAVKPRLSRAHGGGALPASSDPVNQIRLEVYGADIANLSAAVFVESRMRQFRTCA